MPMCIVNIDDNIEKATQPARKILLFMLGAWELGTRIFIMTMLKELVLKTHS